MLTPLYFSSTIRIIPARELLPLWLETPKENQINAPWSYRERLSLVEQGATDAISVCNTGGISDQDKLVIYHLLPSRHEYEQDKVEKALTTDCEQLKHPDRKRGFLLGGMRTEEESRSMKEALIGLYRKLAMPFSVLWGQQNGGSAQVHYSTQTDTWSVVLRKAGSWEYVTSLEELKKEVEHIHIADGDTLYIGDRHIPNELANQEIVSKDSNSPPSYLLP